MYINAPENHPSPKLLCFIHNLKYQMAFKCAIITLCYFDRGAINKSGMQMN